MEQNIVKKENMIVENLESQIKNNQFNSKEALIQHITQLRNEQGHSNVLDNEKIQALLNLFDSMRQKEKISIIPLTDSMSLQNIDAEILNKIRFFITNINMDLNSFMIDTKTGIFYHTETSKIYEVRKDEITNEYKIFKEQERIYGNNTEQLTEENTSQQLENEQSQEEISYNSSLYKPKTRVRKLEINPYTMNNAAFTKVGFLIINILTFAILTGMIILLNKTK